MKYVGIDYSMGLPGPNGLVPNRDPETGVRYGILPRDLQPDWIWDHVESEYHTACPGCSRELTDDETDELECSCGATWEETADCIGEEPDCNTFSLDGVEGFLDSDGDLWITKSPVTTTGLHCSPCAPGAVTIEREPVEGGPECYSIPADWFPDRS